MGERCGGGFWGSRFVWGGIVGGFLIFGGDLVICVVIVPFTSR